MESNYVLPALVCGNRLRIYFNRQHREKFRDPAIFNSEFIVNLDRAPYKDFILFKKEVWIFFEDEFQNRITVRSRIVLFGDFIIQHGIYLNSLLQEI